MAPPSTAGEWPPPEAYNEIITIIASKEITKVYSVHKGVLIFYSGYFENMLQDGSKEAESREVKLRHTEPRVFDAVQNWLYSHRLHPVNEPDLEKMSIIAISQVSVFAEAHDIPALQNSAINLMHQITLARWIVPNGALTYVYANTVASSHLRPYCIAIISKTGYAESLLKTTAQEGLYTKEALVDILRIVWASGHTMQGKEAVKNWNLCDYHAHEKGVKCGKNASR